MKTIICDDIFSTSANPRVDNGWKYKQNEELGQCERCGAVTTAYLKIDGVNYIEWPFLLCKGCLEDGIDMINKEILNGLQR